MATSHSTPALQLLHTSHVVPFPARPAPEEITQLEIAALLSLRNRLVQLESQIADAEQSIRTRLETNANVEPGEHTAQLRESFRRSVSWRDVAERLAAKLYGPRRASAFCDNVLGHTRPTRTVTVQIQ